MSRIADLLGRERIQVNLLNSATNMFDDEA